MAVTLLQNDPIADIVTHLANNGFENVFRDGFKQSPDNASDLNYNQIMVERTGGDVTNSPVQELTFAVYVKNKSQSIAIENIRKVKKLLASKGFKLAGTTTVPFKWVRVFQDVQRWDRNTNDQVVYRIGFEATIANHDIETIYNQD